MGFSRRGFTNADQSAFRLQRRRSASQNTPRAAAAARGGAWFRTEAQRHPISYTEFAPAARDYPVVFTSGDGGKSFAPVAVLA